MKTRDLEKVSDAIECLTMTCATIHRNITYTQEYDYNDDVLWKLRVYLSNLNQKVTAELQRRYEE